MPQKPITEQEAFIALQKGSEKGLEAFFNRYYASLVYYAASITNNSEAAKEIASEAFIKLWSTRGTIEERRKVRFLLYQIVYNASINYTRHQKTQKQYITYLNQVPEQSEPSPLQKLIEAETYHHLHQLLQTLSPRSRQIFHMFYFQNKAIKEIAAELGISVNTVKTQKLRAIQTLKQHQGTFYFFIAYSLIFI